ncbi:unnamed protein product [Schistosoma mattheei]|uniref:Uncharacterized protein n=1 Tax=Schistosoma mattheei TaxID=31246 RepID=A0A183PJX6_9TREM|nr:unnamed protein product [Schistosoma mattheei]
MNENGLYSGYSVIDDDDGSCSESTLVALLAARNKAITQYQNIHPNVNNYDALSKLVGYYSDQAHSSVERAGLIGMLQLRAIKSNEHYELDTTILEQTIEDDVNNGLIPFFCCATLGTTATCGFDKLKDIGPICDKYNIWLHVDAAYAGSSFICPEYRYLMDGIEVSVCSFVCCCFDEHFGWCVKQTVDNSEVVKKHFICTTYLCYRFR